MFSYIYVESDSVPQKMHCNTMSTPDVNGAMWHDKRQQNPVRNSGCILMWPEKCILLIGFCCLLFDLPLSGVQHVPVQQGKNLFVALLD